MVITLTISAFVFSMRAVFFAPMDEVNVPRDITGSAMSIGSFVGYLPGAFMYAVYGAIQHEKRPASHFLMPAFFKAKNISIITTNTSIGNSGTLLIFLV